MKTRLISLCKWESTSTKNCQNRWIGQRSQISWTTLIVNISNFWEKLIRTKTFSTDSMYVRQRYNLNSLCGQHHEWSSRRCNAVSRTSYFMSVPFEHNRIKFFLEKPADKTTFSKYLWNFFRDVNETGSLSG